MTTPTSPADILREAATLIRERANLVTQGAQWSGGNYWITDYDPSDPTGQTAMQRLIGGMNEPDADHYANLTPAVALAVAAWLEWMADRSESSNGIPAMRGLGLDEALTVARTYLGRSA